MMALKIVMENIIITKPLNQNKMKQTAVEWLEERINIGLTYEQEVLFEGLFEQAKELEKQQIIKAVYESMGTNIDPNIGRAEQYYNQTFKSE